MTEKCWPAASTETALVTGSWSGTCPSIFSAANDIKRLRGVSKRQHRGKSIPDSIEECEIPKSITSQGRSAVTQALAFIYLTFPKITEDEGW